MDVNAFMNMLVEGLDPEGAAYVRKAVDRDLVKAKVAELKSHDEYQALVTELEGENGRPGARNFQTWYNDNFDKIGTIARENQELKLYRDRYGSLESPKQPVVQQQQPPVQAPGISREEVGTLIQQALQQTYAPQWGNIISTTGSIMQKHLLKGRKNTIDFNNLGEIAKKYSGNLEAAYEEWDKPEQEKQAKADMETEIERRVKEKVQQLRSSRELPATGTEFTPGAMTFRPKTDHDKFDRGALLRDLQNTFVNGVEETH
jgi:hypothetical protein